MDVCEVIWAVNERLFLVVQTDESVLNFMVEIGI
jgi:hypothetical protein